MLASGPARSDWVDVAKFGQLAELSIIPGEIRLDLRLNESLMPKGVGFPGEASPLPPTWLAERLPTLRANGGKPLAGRLLSLDRVPSGSPETTEAGRSGEAYYAATLSYPTEGRLEGLSIAPPPGGTQASGLVVLHRGVPVSDLMRLNKTVNLRLDWHDPWRTRFDDPGFVRRHAEPRSYLYVETYEVRHELLLRLHDLQPWLDLGLLDSRTVEEGERGALKQKIGAFLLARNPLSIDGAAVPPQLDRVEFVRFDRSGVMPVGEHDRLETDTALVGVMLTYLTDQPAKQLRLQWDLFGANPGPRQVDLIQGKESFAAYMTPKHPWFEWSQDDALDPLPAGEAESEGIHSIQAGPPVHGPGFSLAWVAAGLVVGSCLSWFKPRLVGRDTAVTGLGLGVIVAVGLLLHPLPDRLAWKKAEVTPALDGNQAKRLLQPLLHNAYRAFQVRDEEKAYDRLAKSLDGSLLDEIYLQQRKAMLRQAKGLGGEGRVDRVEVLDSQVQGLGRQPDVVRMTSRWLAHGSVSHWGHTHERHNLYQARLRLKHFNAAGWKIVGMEFLDGQRLEPGASG